MCVLLRKCSSCPNMVRVRTFRMSSTVARYHPSPSLTIIRSKCRLSVYLILDSKDWIIAIITNTNNDHDLTELDSTLGAV